MATLNAVIRWADNTAQLTANLTKGADQMDAAKQSAEKMVNALSGPGLNLAIQSTSTLSDHLRTAVGLLGAFGIGFSVVGLVQFGRSLLDDADALVKMSDRTGIAIEDLERMQKVGDTTSVTIEDMTNAVNQMQNRIAGGDKSAVEAFKVLGINMEAFLKLNAYQQFIQLSDALRLVEDPAKQVQLGIDAMGKAFLGVWPAMKQGFDEVRSSAVGMSEDTVRAMDAAGDAVAAWWRAIKGYTSLAIVELSRVANEGFNPLETGARHARAEMDSWPKALKAAMDNADAIKPKLAGMASPELQLNLEQVTRELDNQREVLNAHRRVSDEAAEAAKRLSDEHKKIADARAAATYAEITDSINDSRDATLDATKAIATGMNPQLMELKVRLGIVTLASQQTIGVMALMSDQSAAAGDRIKADLIPSMTSFEKILSGLPDLLMAAFTGGGGAVGALKAFSTSVTKTLFSAGGQFEGFTKTVSGMFGKDGLMGAIGKTLGGLVPVVGAAIGPAIELIAGLFKSAESKINPLRLAFVDAAGGLDELRDKATAAGVTIDALLNAKNAEQYKAAIDALNLAFDDHAKDISRAKELIDEYGLSIEQLGPKWRSQQLTEQVDGLLNDLRIMVDVLGLDMSSALVVMKDKFQGAFDTALKFGIELPPQMEPILKKLVEMGLLLDDNGAVVTDLQDTGVKFSETFATSVDRLIKKFDEFMERLGLIPGMINNIPSDKWVTVHVRSQNEGGGDVPGAAFGGMVTRHGIQYLGMGGNVLPFRPRGSDTVPAMLTPGEEVIPVGGRAKEMAPVVAAIDRLGRDLKQTLPLAVRDEIQKVSRGRR
jgi:hypothetical protein